MGCTISVKREVESCLMSQYSEHFLSQSLLRMPRGPGRATGTGYSHFCLKTSACRQKWVVLRVRWLQCPCAHILPEPHSKSHSTGGHAAVKHSRALVWDHLTLHFSCSSLLVRPEYVPQRGRGGRSERSHPSVPRENDYRSRPLISICTRPIHVHPP